MPGDERVVLVDELDDGDGDLSSGSPVSGTFWAITGYNVVAMDWPGEAGRWELLKHIYEVDPLLCPCGGKLKRIALILDPAVIQKILRHLKRWPPPRRPPKRPRDPPPAHPRREQHQEPPLSEAEGSQLPLWEDNDEIWSQLPAHEEG